MTAKQFIVAHYPLIGILIAGFLIATSMGTYTNWDSQLEFEAATNVLQHGYPIVTAGLIINQPPLGFYTAAPVFQLLGLTYANGVALATAFGLGCVALVYALGTILYGKRTGLVASAVFAFIPWHVYMSRIFLIDNQCMFLSLLALIFGVFAVRRNSEKLLLAAGTVFALAFLTKLFAVFIVVPLLLVVYFNRKDGGGFTLTKRAALLFLLPSLVLQAVWFGGFANQNFFGVYFNTDFTQAAHVDNPSVAYLATIFSESSGYFLFIAVALSLVLVAVYRKQLAKLLRLDAVCLAMIAVVCGANALLVLGFHMVSPYVAVVKYTYLALPFFCLLAASLVDKGAALLGSMDRKVKRHWIKPALLGLGAVLLFASLVENTLFLNAWWGFVSFGVDSVTYYPFDTYSAPSNTLLVTPYHYAALAIIIVSFSLPFLPSSMAKMRQSLAELRTILSD